MIFCFSECFYDNLNEIVPLFVCVCVCVCARQIVHIELHSDGIHTLSTVCIGMYNILMLVKEITIPVHSLTNYLDGIINFTTDINLTTHTM